MKPVISLTFFLIILAIGLADATEHTISATPYGFTTSVSDGDSDRYNIYLNEGDIIEIIVTVASGDADLFLYDPNGNMADSSLNWGTETDSITYTADVSGTWQIEVYGFLTSVYSIEVNVQRAAVVTTTTTTVTPTVNPDPSSEPRYPSSYPNNNDQSHAGRVYPDIAYHCYLGAGDDDYFYFTISETRHVIIETLYLQSPAADTVVSVFGADGSAWGTDDDSGSGTFSRLEADMPAGTYYIYVRGASTSSTGYYRLRVTTTSPTSAVTPTPVYVPPTTTTTPAPVAAPEEQPWYQPITQPLQDAWNWLTGLPEGIRTSVEQQLSNAINSTIAIFTEPIIMVRDLMTNIFNAVAQPILSVFEAIGGIFQGIADTINSVVRQTFGLGGG